MKKLLLSLLLAAVTFNLSGVYAHALIFSNEITVLRKNMQENNSLSNKQVDLIYNYLSEEVKKEQSVQDTKDLLLLSLLYFKYDASPTIYDLVTELKSHSLRNFNQALDLLSLEEKRQIEAFVQIQETMLIEGQE